MQESVERPHAYHSHIVGTKQNNHGSHVEQASRERFPAIRSFIFVIAELFAKHANGSQAKQANGNAHKQTDGVENLSNSVRASVSTVQFCRVGIGQSQRVGLEGVQFQFLFAFHFVQVHQGGDGDRDGVDHGDHYEDDTEQAAVAHVEWFVLVHETVIVGLRWARLED